LASVDAVRQAEVARTSAQITVELNRESIVVASG
jgi:hypothetical protein